MAFTLMYVANDNDNDGDYDAACRHCAVYFDVLLVEKK